METLLSTLAIVAVLGFVVFGVLQGLKNGWKKQVVRLATIVISLFVSILITKAFSNTLISWIGAGDSLKNLFEEVLELSQEEINALMPGGEALGAISYIAAIPIAFIVSPIVFLIVYGIFHFVTIIPYKIFTKSVIGKSKKNGIERVIGMAVGAIYGFLIAVILMSPVAGITDMVYDTYDSLTATVEENESDEAHDIQEIFEDIELPESDPTIKILGSLGGEFIYKSISTVEINGNTYVMTEEVAEPTIELIAAISGLEDMEIDELTDEDKESIDAIIAVFEKSNYMKDLFADALIYVSGAYENGVLSDEMNFDDHVGIIIDALFEVLANIANDPDHLSDNLHTVLDAYYVLTDNGIIKNISEDPNNAVSALMTTIPSSDGGNTTVMAEVVRRLNNNATTVPLVTALSKVSVAVLADTIGNEDIVKVYEDVKTAVSEISTIDVNDSQYVEKVSGILGNAINEHGLDIDEETTNSMAEYLQENHEEIFAVGDADDDGVISDQEMNNIILSYYEVYVASGELDLPTDIPVDLPSDIPEFN